MSEWMGVKVNGRLVSVYRFFNGSAPEPLYTLDEARAVPVHVVEDAEPCEWEKKQGMGHKNVAHFMKNEDAIVQMKFCPMCGRPFGGDE